MIQQSAFKPRSLFKRIDWLTLFLLILLALVGIVSIYSVEYRAGDTLFFDFSKSYAKQTIFFGLALIIGLFIIVSNSKIITSIPFLVYLIGFLFLLLALTPLGKGVKARIHGSFWVSLPFTRRIDEIFTSLA
jgi:hypothetical protein